MNNKYKQLIFALLLGVIAIMATKWYINRRIEAAQPGEMVKVLLARSDLNQGALIHAENFTISEVPRRYIPKAALTKEDLDRFSAEGQRLEVSVAKDDYLLESYFSITEIQGDKLSKQINTKGDERAITIPVDQNNSLARSIVTGDKIDIIFIFNIPLTNQKMASFLLQNVPVISTGSYSAADDVIAAEEQSRYSTITLKLSARDALRLSYAQQAGSIQILLRNSEDSSLVEVTPLSGLMDLLSVADRQRVDQIAKEVQPSADMLKGQLDRLFEEQKRQDQLRR